MKQDYVQIKALELAPQVYVSGQVFEQDLQLAAQGGVRTVMNNRPDGEAPGQPLSVDLERAAKELGLNYVYHPVDPRAVTMDDVKAFGEACKDLERPLLIFCRSGARSTKIWELSETL